MDQADGLIGAVVLDVTGTEIGAVAALRVDPADRHARWLDLTLAGGGRATVPVQAASADGSGRLVLPFSGDDVRTAPRADGPVLSTDLADDLLRHYGFPPETR